jgi:predicted phage terminase large subunit-like protein
MVMEMQMEINNLLPTNRAEKEKLFLLLRDKQRRKALVNYATYVEYVNQGRWLPSRHLIHICGLAEQLINDTLTDAEGNPIQILIFSLPPQHGKSVTITECLPSFYLGKHPDRRVIEASYGDDLAQRFGRRNKQKIREFGKDLFSIEIDRAHASDTAFDIAEHQGGMISRGIMSSITGNPGDLIVIDDPIKNRQEADSKTYRNRLWEEWQNSIKTRMSARAKVVLILTRWHEDDLAGRIIENEPGVMAVNIPCEAEEDDPIGRMPGDALFPEIGKDRAWKDRFKDSYINDPTLTGGGLRAWSALYQGHPVAMLGNVIKQYWWRYWMPRGVELPPVTVKDKDGNLLNIDAVELPDNFDRQIQSWDLTFKNSQGSDFVAGGIWASSGARIYCLDQIYERLDFPGTIQAVLSLTAKWPNAITKLVEDKANGPAVIAMLQKDVHAMVPVQPDGDKVARMSAVSPLIEAGNVFLPHPLIAGWVNAYIEQCCSFPNAPHDDYVDETSQALRHLMYARDKKPKEDLTEIQKHKRKMLERAGVSKHGKAKLS